MIKKLIKIPIIQAIKSIKTSVTNIVKITDRNAGMQNELNCQITGIRKMSAKLFINFPKFLWNTFKTVGLDVRCWKF